MTIPDKAQQSPLEQLQEMNERVGKARKSSARPRDPTKKVERYYRAQLNSLIRLMSKRVKEDVLPVIKEEKAEYRQGMGDSMPDYTADAWSDRVIQAIQAVAGEFISGAFAQQYERIAQQTVSMAESESTQAFVESVNQAVGVDMSKMIDNEGLREYTEAAAYQNAQLVKNIPEKYFTGIENAVLGGVRGGDAPSTIAKKITEQTGIAGRRANEIARDQTAKLTGEITERRQRQAGIKYFQWITSKDERVGDDHRRAAQRDVGYGPGTYKWSKPPKEGVPGNSTRPNCRCTAKPIFEFEIAEKKR